nr:RNA-binding KH domain-containing protein [Tanacetum cinerariifolium]
MQALSLIGKQGTVIKSIHENTSCPMRVLSGEAIKVLKALKAMIGHLRKFLVDHGVLPLFEKTNVAAAATSPQEQQVETSWADKPMMRTAGLQLGLGGADYALPIRRETLFLDRLSLYGCDPALSTMLPITRSARIARTGRPFVTQFTCYNSDEALLGISNKRRETDHVTDFTEFKSQFFITYSNIRLL